MNLRQLIEAADRAYVGGHIAQAVTFHDDDRASINEEIRSTDPVAVFLATVLIEAYAVSGRANDCTAEDALDEAVQWLGHLSRVTTQVTQGLLALRQEETRHRAEREALRDKLFPVSDPIPEHVVVALGGDRCNIRGQATGEFRSPLAGEWYVSRVIPKVYVAVSGISAKCHIARLVQVAAEERVVKVMS